MGAFALVSTLVLACAGLFLGLIGGPSVAAVCAVGAPVLGVPWGLWVGYPSVLPLEAQPT
jgi:hypothetical protein